MAEIGETVKLPSPIILVDASNKQFSFDKLETFIAIIKDEQKFWAERLVQHSEAYSFSANQYLNVSASIEEILELVKTWKKQLSIWSESEYSAQINSLHTTHLSVFNTKWIWSGHSFVKPWLDSYKLSHATGEGFIEVILINSISNYSNYDWLKGYLLAYEYQLQDESGIASRREAELESFGHLKDGLLEQMYSLISDISDFRAEAASITRTYVEFMRLKGPAAYWNLRAEACKKQGQRWTALLIGTIVTAGAIFIYLMCAWLAAYHTELKLNTLEGAVIFASIISLFAFAIKTFSKLTFSAFHLQRDAEEREQLTHLYLALSNDNKVDAESRTIVLQALFSRSDSGLLAGDHSPTMPSIQDAMRVAGKGN